MPSLVGQSIGRYHVIEQLGEGGMAQVYKAFDNRLERNVAVKVILPSQQQSEMFLKRFEREAKSLAQLSHSNIVKVLDYGDQDGMPYLIMEYVSGGTLKQRLGKPMLYAEAARILLPIANALGYAHARGIYHRDVKPANILINEAGQPMLSDFGIAKVLETEDHGGTLTGTGVGIGTPDYMSPEQGMGSTIDQRADEYSLAVVFYELVTGRKPYRADTPMAVLLKQMNDPLPRPREFVPDLPEAVEQVIFKAMAKRPEDRYPDMAAFAIALERLSQQNLPGAQETLVGVSAAPTLISGAAATTISAPGSTQVTATRLVGAAQPASGAVAAPAKPAKRRSWLPFAIVGAILVLGLGAVLAGGALLFKLGSPKTAELIPQVTSIETQSPNSTSAGPSISKTATKPGKAQASPQVEPTIVQQATGDSYSTTDISLGLDKLDSYVVDLVTETTTESGGKTVDYSESYKEEKSAGRKHWTIYKDVASSGASETKEFFLIDGVMYFYDPDKETCEIAGTGQEGLVAAIMEPPKDQIGAVQNALLATKGEAVNDATADVYSLEKTNLETMDLVDVKGTLWLTQPDKYVAKISLEGRTSSGSLLWDYNVTDIGVVNAIELPTVCNSPSAGSGPDIPLPANANNISKIGGIITFKSSDASQVVASFFKLALPPKGWAIQAQNAAAQYTILIFMNSDTDEILQIMIQAEGSGSNTTVTLQGN